MTTRDFQKKRKRQQSQMRHENELHPQWHPMTFYPVYLLVRKERCRKRKGTIDSLLLVLPSKSAKCLLCFIEPDRQNEAILKFSAFHLYMHRFLSAIILVLRMYLPKKRLLVDLADEYLLASWL
jgi:hypothetical protein